MMGCWLTIMLTISVSDRAADSRQQNDNMGMLLFSSESRVQTEVHTHGDEPQQAAFGTRSGFPPVRFC